MTTSVELGTRSTGYMIGWWILLVIAGLGIVGYLASVRLAATAMEVAAFFALAGINIYTVSVGLTAYRRGELWAWWVTWVQVAVYGMTIPYAPELRPWYLGPTIVIAIAQVLTWPAFRKHAAF